jgi:hypothetical protein
MANLSDTQVYGSLTIDTALVASAGSGYSNMVVYISGTSQTYTFPPALQVPGAKFKTTIVGGGGGGAGTGTTSGVLAGGGASGAVCVAVITVVAGLYSFVYSVGAAGTAGAINSVGGAGGTSSVVYNGTTYQATGGAGGSGQISFAISTGGRATNGILNLQGGYGGGGGLYSANQYFSYHAGGGNTPLGLGQGGDQGCGAGGGVAIGVGYGAGSGGSYTIAAASVVGSIGAPGLLIIEY